MLVMHILTLRKQSAINDSSKIEELLNQLLLALAADEVPLFVGSSAILDLALRMMIAYGGVKYATSVLGTAVTDVAINGPDYEEMMRDSISEAPEVPEDIEAKKKKMN